ncbi:GNAT family N-acetyltransferase [Bacillus sp. SCS-153A]|uniref:GNAT family N-acetyltransferase n=1 Tax=Rossellomorea sedimentorum TaxID=3115294 RepID=UPI00390655B9
MLNDQQLKDIEGLQKVCELHGDYQLKLNEDMLRSRTHGKDDFFHYEDGKLIGFLGLYGFGSSYELCGMVHPDFHQKGIFQKLFQQSVSSLKERRIKKLLINVPGTSASGKLFIGKLSAQYSFSEYQMKWEPKQLNAPNQDIHLIPVTQEDTPFILELDLLCFDVEKDDSLEFMDTVQKDEASSSFIIQYKGEKVGKIHIQREENKSYIFGFAVHPSHQGKGVGREVLAKTVLTESKTGRSIFLEVAAKNAHALKLYEDTGFVSYQVQDYYTYEGL